MLTMNKENFGMYLSMLRKENSLTQAELAEKIHVTDKAISKWERGIGLPDIHNLEPLADALGVSVLEIMKSERIRPAASDEQAEEAVKNTIALAKVQKKNFRMKIIAIAMLYIALKSIYGIFVDTAIPSNYNNLPISLVYILLALYIVITGIVSFNAFKRSNR